MTDNKHSDAALPEVAERLEKAYHNMLERIHHAWEKTDEKLPDFRSYLDHAHEKAIELEELSREEAQMVSTYIKRDIEEAADYLNNTGKELHDWLRFDIQRLEEEIWQRFSSVADKTRIELEALADQAFEASQYHTGEMAAPGVLRCNKCGKELHFDKVSHIPPCPVCHHTEYTRQVDEA